jgi:2-polyprenyl-3-methyl-5-hydroxy-6-metoxy-1,4-benzoquinol methylase
MGLFRVQHTKFEETFNMTQFDTEHSNEWEDAGRIQEDAWQERYAYEASILNEVIAENSHIKSVLELGPGPGVLSQKILETNPHLEYDLIDKPFAHKYFTEHNFTGRFFIKDLSNDFDTSGLKDTYDLVIANDFIEHVYNPHIILKTVHQLTTDRSIFFISNPNWRMSHQYVYRGLFDFDNFIYLLYTHMFELDSFYGSQLKTPFYPKLSSESLLPDDNVTDWNHYMLFKHR